MITLMVSATMATLVGMSVTAKYMSAIPASEAKEPVVAAAFLRYKKAVDCYAGLTPGVASTPTEAQLKAAVSGGVPCMNASYVVPGGFGSVITLTNTYTYYANAGGSNLGAPPIMEFAKYIGAFGVGGLLRNGQIINPAATSGTGVVGSVVGVAVVGNLPNGSLVMVGNRF